MKSKWPELSYSQGKDTYYSLHMFSQILGKIQLACLPWQNHSWHVALRMSPEGLATKTLSHENISYQLVLDLVQHKLKLQTSLGENREFKLQGLSVAGFHQKLFSELEALKIFPKIYNKPVEVLEAIPFQKNTHNNYDPEAASALHRALLAMQDVFFKFKCGFKGKSSEVHFFWGSFDVAVSLFSGRKAPKHPGGIPNLANRVAEEAYSHEVMSFGFWPGSEALPDPAFYSYLYPEPDGFNKAKVQPAKAFYHKDLREFVLPYKAVQQAENPEEDLMAFLKSVYNAGTELANWDREALE